MEKGMIQFNSQGVRSLIFGALGVFAMACCAQAGLAQQTVPAKPVAVTAMSSQTAAASPAAKPVAEEEETAKPGKPGGEGIRVHGHWVLQVKNLDGTLGERREFDNSLITTNAGPGGDGLLVSLLAGGSTPGGLGIAMITVDPTQYPDPSSWCTSKAVSKCYPVTQAGNIFFNLPSLGYTSPFQTGLTTSIVFAPGGYKSPTLVLAANFTVPYPLTTVNAVQTFESVCIGLGAYSAYSAQVGAGSCSNSNDPALVTQNFAYFPFTATVIGGTNPSPLTNLTTGQVIQVTVTLSFS